MEKKWDEAQSAFESSINLNFTNQDAHFELGKVLLTKRMTQRAVEEFQQTLTPETKGTTHHFYLASALIEGNKLDEAIEVLNTASQIEPNNEKILFKLCQAFSKKGYYTVAISHCKKAVELSDDFYDAMNRLAWLYAKKRINLDKAKILSDKTISAHPDEPGYIDTLSEIFYVQGKKDLAISNIRSAIKLDPNESYYKKQLWKFKNIDPKTIAVR